jgi:hypothetical protein
MFTGSPCQPATSEWPTIWDLWSQGHLTIKVIGVFGLDYGLAGGFPYVR